VVQLQLEPRRQQHLRDLTMPLVFAIGLNRSSQCPWNTSYGLARKGNMHTALPGVDRQPLAPQVWNRFPRHRPSTPQTSPSLHTQHWSVALRSGSLLINIVHVSSRADRPKRAEHHAPNNSRSHGTISKHMKQ
jgi:hypothetical protein